MLENLFETIVTLKKTGDFVALAIIVRTDGSTPRRVGTKMLILKGGKTIGTMGGGDLEKKVIERALEAIGQGEPRITSFTLDIEKGKLDMMCGGKLDVYIEPILQKDKFPETEDLVLTDMEQFARDLPSDPWTYIVLLSRGFSKDKAILTQLIEKDFKYIGMIGSVRKIGTLREDRQKKGIPQDAFRKFWAPIGLDIGAETPEEIAISIAAEIIAAKKGKLEINRKKGVTENVTERL